LTIPSKNLKYSFNRQKFERAVLCAGAGPKIEPLRRGYTQSAIPIFTPVAEYSRPKAQHIECGTWIPFASSRNVVVPDYFSEPIL